MLHVNGTTDQLAKSWVQFRIAVNVQALVCKVTNTWCEAKTQQVHQGKNVISESSCIREMLFYSPAGTAFLSGVILSRPVVVIAASGNSLMAAFNRG